MKRLFVASLTVAAMSMGLFGSAAAQEVDILRFETFDVEQELMDQFYSELHRAVTEHDDLTLGSGGDVSIDDLLLVAGCESPTPDCLSMLSDFVDGDQLVFGSVQRSDDVYMFTIRLYDFASQEFTREISEQTLRGDRQWISEGVPAVIEHFIHGPTATLHVDISGEENAEVRLNGQAAGQGSVTVDTLPPGEMVVVILTADGEERMERVILRHGQEHRVEFDFAPAVSGIVDPPPPGRDGPSLVPGFALAGVGVAGLVLGVVGNSQLSAAESEANTLVGGRSALHESELERARGLQDDMNRAHTMRVIGFSVGPLALVGGSVLLFMALSGDSGVDTELAGGSDRGFSFDVGASSDGINAGFRIGF